jgi:hypothetical protein
LSVWAPSLGVVLITAPLRRTSTCGVVAPVHVRSTNALRPARRSVADSVIGPGGAVVVVDVDVEVVVVVVVIVVVVVVVPPPVVRNGPDTS